MQVLGLDLLAHRLDEITHGNQPDQFAAVDHGQLADVVPGHLPMATAKVSFGLQVMGSGVMTSLISR